MKSYYEEVDFGVTVEVEQTPEAPDSQDISTQLKAIRTELSLIGSGQSDLVGHAIHFGSRIYPHVKALKTMEEFPTKDNIRNFVSLINNDINRRTAQYFASLFITIDPTINEVFTP